VAEAQTVILLQYFIVTGITKNSLVYASASVRAINCTARFHWEFGGAEQPGPDRVRNVHFAAPPPVCEALHIIACRGGGGDLQLL
jgi:hypothetical protein